MDERVMTGLPNQNQGTEARLGAQRRDDVRTYLLDPRNPVYVKNITPSVINIKDRWGNEGLNVTLRGFQAISLNDVDRQQLASSEAFKKALFYGQIVLIDEEQYMRELESYKATLQQQALLQQQRMQVGLIDVDGRPIQAQILDSNRALAPATPDPRQMLRDPISYARAAQDAMARGISPEQFAQMVENQRVPIGIGAQIGQPQVVSGGISPGMGREASRVPAAISAVGNVSSVPHGAYDPVRMTRTGGATVAAPIGHSDGSVPNYPTVPMGNFNMQGTIPGYGGYVGQQAAPTIPPTTIPQPGQAQPMYPTPMHAEMGFQQQVPTPMIYTSIPQPPPQQPVYPGQPQPMPQGPLASGQAEAVNAQQAWASEGVPMEISGHEADDARTTMMQAGIPPE